jgi:4-amino-4-deoxy-L-arabinose transferase-like glycosyltransferase
LSERIGLGLIVLAVIAGAVLRLHAIGGDDRLSTDELGYIGDANRLLSLNGYDSFHWAPGTPALFAVIGFLTGHSEISAVTHSHGIAQYAQWLVELATLLLAGAFAWRLAGAWAALLAVAAIATYGPLIEVTRTYLSEPLGGLMLVAMVCAAIVARRRSWRWLAAAGVVAGLACLAREDYVPGVFVIAAALGLERSSGQRRSWRSAAVYLSATLLTLAPWVAFASHEEGGLVVVTSGGTDTLFIGTYLPGDGAQFQTVAAFKVAVCRRFPKECNSPPGDAAPLFQLIGAEHPGDTHNQAVIAAVLANLRHYMLGRPFAFAAMLARKLWAMWSAPWSGGNGTALSPGSAQTALDDIYVGAAWLGLLLAAWLYRRRWAVVVPAAVLVVIIFFNDWFGPEPRDTLRLAPLLFVLGAVGLAGVVCRLAERSRAATGEPPGGDPPGDPQTSPA